MRMTVQDLMNELEDKHPKARVEFQSGMKNDGEPAFKNHVQRIDNFGDRVVIVIEKGA